MSPGCPDGTSSMTTQICLTHWMMASGVPEMVTARSVELGSMSPATWTWAPVDCRNKTLEGERQGRGWWRRQPALKQSSWVRGGHHVEGTVHGHPPQGPHAPWPLSPLLVPWGPVAGLRASAHRCPAWPGAGTVMLEKRRLNLQVAFAEMETEMESLFSNTLSPLWSCRSQRKMDSRGA